MSKVLSKKKTTETVVSQKAAKDPAVQISIEFHGAYTRLANVQTKDKVEGQEQNFLRMVDLFMLAAVHGHKGTGKKPLTDSKRVEIFREHNFSADDKVIIKAIALLEESKKKNPNPDIINSPSAMVEIMEEYANGGFQDLLKKIDSSPDFEANYVRLLAQELQKDKQLGS